MRTYPPNSEDYSERAEECRIIAESMKNREISIMWLQFAHWYARQSIKLAEIEETRRRSKGE